MLLTPTRQDVYTSRSNFLRLLLAWVAGAVLLQVGISTAAAGDCMDLDNDGYGSPGDPSCPNGSETDCDDDNEFA